jgi:hypothetical protein
MASVLSVWARTTSAASKVSNRFIGISFLITRWSHDLQAPEAKADIMSRAKNAIRGQGGLADGPDPHEACSTLTCDGHDG